MDKLTQLLHEKKQLQDHTYRELDEAAYILSEPVEKQIMRQYFIMRDIRDKYLDFDVLDGRYMRKTEEQYEAMRLKALQDIENETSVEKQIEILIETAKTLKDAAFFLNYNETIENCLKVPFMMDVAKNMFTAGFSIKDVYTAIPYTSMTDVCGMAKMLGFDVKPTEEEQAFMDEEARKKAADDEQYPPNSMAGILKK